MQWIPMLRWPGTEYEFLCQSFGLLTFEVLMLVSIFLTMNEMMIDELTA